MQCKYLQCLEPCLHNDQCARKPNTVPTVTCSADPRRTPRVRSEWRPVIRPSVSKKERSGARARARDKQKFALRVDFGERARSRRAVSTVTRTRTRRILVRVVISDYNNLPKHTAITHQHITQHKPTGDQDHVRKTHRRARERTRIASIKGQSRICQTSHTPDPRHKTRSACASIQPRAPLPVNCRVQSKSVAPGTRPVPSDVVHLPPTRG